MASRLLVILLAVGCAVPLALVLNRRLRRWYFPELDQLPREANRDAVFKKAFADRSSKTIPPLYSGASGLVLCVVVGRLSRLTSAFDGILEMFAVVMLFLVAVSLGYSLLTMMLFQNRIRAFLYRQLVEHGVPVCLSCGYNLTGCPSDRCPECGTPIANET